MAKKKLKKILLEFVIKDLLAIVLKYSHGKYRPNGEYCDGFNTIVTCIDNYNLLQPQEHGNIYRDDYEREWIICMTCHQEHSFNGTIPDCVKTGIANPTEFYQGLPNLLSYIRSYY